ncbi:MAG: nickel pincer cofactor biosynthesis protein LarC [Desulfitobacteriia bacterium]|jgi:uncharacterized protein (TIGR00299 family) protein
MKILYYDCFCGISGDMNLGALLDLGIEKDYLLDQLKLLGLEDKYEIIIRKESRSGIEGTRVEIIIPEENEYVPPTRNYGDINKIISESALNPGIKSRALKMLELLAEAESKVHGVDKSQVHFHEVGALDSILDLVGAAICLEHLRVDKIISSRVELGGGFVRCAHGTLPVPVPAVVELLKGLPVKTGRVAEETTTPTGAAILVANVDKFTDQQEFKIEKVGYGVGKRELEIPNLLRVYLGTLTEDVGGLGVEDYMIETNLDDMNPEFYELIETKLFKAGAKDVFKTSIIMKKGRPGVKLSVLAKAETIPAMEEIILKESTAIGLRKYAVQKRALPRKIVDIETKYGKVAIKCSFYGGRIIKAKPEFEDCKKIAEKNQLSLDEVYREINSHLQGSFNY